VVEIPHEDGFAGELDELLLLAELLLAVAQRLLEVSTFGDIDERDDDAADLIIDRSIGPHPHQIPALRAGVDLALDGRQILEYAASVIGQRIILQLMREIGDRTALVAGSEAEEIGDALSEPLDTKELIEEQRCEVGCSHEILQVIMGAGNRLKLVLQLV